MTWRLPGVNQLYFLIQALVIWPLFTLQFGGRLKEYLLVLKSAGNTAGIAGIHTQRLDPQDSHTEILYLQGVGLCYLFILFSALRFTRHFVSLSMPAGWLSLF